MEQKHFASVLHFRAVVLKYFKKIEEIAWLMS